MGVPSRLAALAGLFPAAAWAFQPLVTDDTGTQVAHGNQFEAAWLRSVDRAPGGRTVTHELPLAHARGITDALDLSVGLSRLKILPDTPGTRERGWGNAVPGAEWRFHDDARTKRSFALKPELRLPESDGREARGLGSARTSYGLGLLVTQETGFGAVHANAALERTNYADDALNAAERRKAWWLSAATAGVTWRYR